MKNIHLVYPEPDVMKSHRFGYSMLLLYIASTLRNNNYSIYIHDFSVEKYNKYDFLKLINNDSVIIIEVDAFPLKRSTNILSSEMIAKDVKEEWKGSVIITIGRQCTLMRKKMDFSDITIFGDSEISIVNVIRDIENGKFNIIYDFGNILDLNNLPYPAYDLVSLAQKRGKTLQQKENLEPSALIETSRGCPGRCSFCQRRGWQNSFITMDIKKVVRIFNDLLNDGIVNIWIIDENFTGNLERAKAVFKEFSKVRYGRKVKICLSSWSKIDNEFIRLAKDAGVSIISFGIESIYVKNQVFYNKIIDVDHLLKIINYADEVGIFTIGNFIIGSPYDTYSSILQDMEFAINSKLDEINIKKLDYMIGSSLFNKLPSEMRNEYHVFSCKENGLSNFTYDEISQIGKKYLNKFKAIRSKRLMDKITRFGSPYYELEQ